MTDRFRRLAASVLLGAGLIGVLVGGSAYLQAWHAGRVYAELIEAERVHPELGVLALEPEWIEQLPSASDAAPLAILASHSGGASLSEAVISGDVGFRASLLGGESSESDGALPVEPRASATELELVGVDFRFYDPPEEGAHARLAVELRSSSAATSGTISLSIPARWFDEYRVIGAVPEVLEDRVAQDGSRHFDFPGLAPQMATTFELHVSAAGDSVTPPEVRIGLLHGQEIGQALPRTVAPRPRPGPASAVTIPRLGIQARVVPTAWEPVPFLVGQIRGSANLSEGNTVLIGHLRGPAGNVFANLERLRPGDEVVAVSRGLEYRFLVSDSSVLPSSDSSPILKTDTPRLTLMTCTGSWNPFTDDYSHRLWVLAEPPELAQKTIAAKAEQAARVAEAERVARVSAEATATAEAARQLAVGQAGQSEGNAVAGNMPGTTLPNQPRAEPAPGAAGIQAPVQTGPQPSSGATQPRTVTPSNRQPPRAGLAFLSPASDARVPRRLMVKGTRPAPIDPDLHAWLLIRAQVEGSRWYLYPREIEANADQSWQVEVDLGGPSNVRHELRIGVVGPDTHAELLGRVSRQLNEPLPALPSGFSEEASIVVTRQ